MAYGRFNGGQGFSKSALKAVNEKVSPAQIERFKRLGYDVPVNSMSYEKAANILKNLKKKTSEER